MPFHSYITFDDDGDDDDDDDDDDGYDDDDDDDDDYEEENKCSIIGITKQKDISPKPIAFCHNDITPSRR